MSIKEINVNDTEMYAFFEEEADKIFSALCSAGQGRKKHRNQLATYGAARIYKSLTVIYETNDVKEEMCLIENVLNILDQYIGIEGMEHLLINNYSAIENGIFLEYSPDGNPKRIREHYKHQFRNAYLGLLFLERLHFDEYIVQSLFNEENEYACYIVNSVVHTDEKKLYEQIREVVYKSYLISALFHDIGYPLAYYFRMADEIHEFTPFFKIINPAVKAEFTEIRALLNNSLMFRTIDNHQILKKYHDNDHGCLSAISYLMNFYFSGSIYQLNPKDRCIVEMAAVAIYKHTDRFDGNHRMIFSQDPISYLLRICDDMQEWQRFLVIIGRTHNYLQCSSCGRIVRPMSGDSKSYACCCGKQFRKITQMDNKKVNYIDICDGLTLSENNGKIFVRLDYNPYSQLELILSDYEAITYRNRGLRDLESMLKFQKYLPDIELQYFVSNNPVALIQNMMKESKQTIDDIKAWIGTIEVPEKMEAMKVFIEKYEEELPDMEKLYGKEVEKNAAKYAGKSQKFVEKNMGEIYMLWEYLKNIR